MKKRYCPECGRSIPFDARICPYCAKMMPMHEGQIVEETGEKKDKTVLIIVAVVIILLIVPMAIAATVYVYVSGMGPSSNWETTPTITCMKIDQDTINTLTIVVAEPETVTWSDLELLVDGYVVNHGMSGLVLAGDVIDITSIAGMNGYGITFRHIPTNTLIGAYDFTAET